MAQYHRLPIYKLTYDLLFRLKLKDETIELVVLIYKANSAADKTAQIDRILERVQVIQLMIRLSHDLRILPRRHYADLAEKTDSLGRQAQGWKKGSGKGEPERDRGHGRAR